MEQLDFDDPQFIEHYFSRVESDLSSILTTIDSDINALWNEENQQKLLIFLHDLTYRTEFKRKQYEYIISSIYNFLEKENIPNKEKTLSEFSPERAKQMQLDSILSISDMLNTATRLTNNYNWFIGINTSDLNFIISDNPVAYISTEFNDVCFPISRRKAIIFRIKDKNAPVISGDVSRDGKTINLSIKSIIIYNHMQIAQAYRYLFGDKKSMLMMEDFYKKAGISIKPTWNF